MNPLFHTQDNLRTLKEKYFADESHHIVMRKGDRLLTEDTPNNRLYLVLEGRLDCFLKDDEGKDYEVQQSVKDMFLGVYSFFSYEHKSYLTVVAAEETRLAYIEKKAEWENSEEFARDFLPVIVHEIYLRQVLSQQMNQERQAAVRKLYESEKMIILGQLAAGLAHELNNAVGTLERNTEWLIAEMSSFLLKKDMFPFFVDTLEKGQQLSTTQIRERREWLEKEYDLSSKTAKQLAKTHLSDEQLVAIIHSGMKNFDLIRQVSEAAVVLHDMRVAASHAAHVVKSVRDLGSQNYRLPVETTLEETLNKALALTKNLTKKVNVKIDRQTEGRLMASPGELVQVWVNIIKNACESMEQAGTQNPVLGITIAEDGQVYSTTISDNGTGITEDVMKRMFEPNFSTKVNGLTFGLGLGLSIVKKIIDSYQGNILIESHPGHTEFTIQLPKP
ncbi:MAG: ATP-binding protein [Bacteroidia bacterium]|nr:ATP-binding protein [Bacteroidia bacterium]